MNEIVDINAGLDRCWDVLADVTTWPQWTASMTSVERLDDGPLRVGSQVRIKQPRMPVLVWEVTELHEGSDFAWAAHSPGARTVGVHRIAANSDGSTRMTLEIQHDGPLAGVVRALTSARTRRYMGMEAAGLKAAAETDA